MTSRGVLKYTASFYPTWNHELEIDLLKRFDLDEKKKVKAMSKGMKAKLSLMCALCPEPDLLLLDEPTSGLDPIVRQELLQTVIGAYQERNPDQHTIFVATHMLHEFEGVVDEFAILHQGRAILTSEMDSAKQRFKKIWLRFANDPPEIQAKEIVRMQREGRELQLVTSHYSEELMSRLQALAPESVHVETLSLEDILSPSPDKGNAPMKYRLLKEFRMLAIYWLFTLVITFIGW